MRSLRVLLVEDEAIVAILFANVLVEMGHEVCAIESNEAGAVAGAFRYKPDVMIVDIRLGSGSGVSAMAEILRIEFVPHVFMSGDLTEIGLLAPDSVALTKPVRVSELAVALQRVVGDIPQI
jgi:two-component system, response regulator PdtaR